MVAIKKLYSLKRVANFLKNPKGWRSPLEGAGEGDIPYSHRHPIRATLTLPLNRIFSDEDTNNIGL
jgi:hypothetical protein